jgi:hypothetical protein
MIRFHPRDIGMWRGIFNFPPKMLPLPDYKEFDSPQEFLDFLVDNKVRLDDPNNKLLFIKKTASDAYDCISLYECVQWSSIGRLEVSSNYIIERLQRMASTNVLTPEQSKERRENRKEIMRNMGYSRVGRNNV